MAKLTLKETKQAISEFSTAVRHAVATASEIYSATIESGFETAQTSALGMEPVITYPTGVRYIRFNMRWR